MKSAPLRSKNSRCGIKAEATVFVCNISVKCIEKTEGLQYNPIWDFDGGAI